MNYTHTHILIYVLRENRVHDGRGCERTDILYYEAKDAADVFNGTPLLTLYLYAQTYIRRPIITIIIIIIIT